MQNRWYGDKRDIVKWSVVVRMLENQGRHVLYVQMLNPDDPAYGNYQLSTGEPLVSEVVRHFRDLNRLATLPLPSGSSFSAVTRPLMPRGPYFQNVLATIAEHIRLHGSRLLVLLDPDTGIAPEGGGNTQHVQRAELSDVFRALRAGDVLATYQHKPLFCPADRDWIGEATSVVSDVLAVAPGQVQARHCLELASDVVLLTVEKL